MLIAFVCFSGHANAKTWYYFSGHTPHSELPLFESMDDFCKAYKFPEQSYFVPSYSPTTCEYYSTRYPDADELFAAMDASTVDCGDPNSKPVVPAWGAPSCECSAGYKADPSASPLRCIPATPPEPEQNSCGAPDGLYSGNPFFLAGAEKFRAETDWTDSGPAALGMVRFYRSNWGSGRPGTPTGLGQAWSHNHAVQLQLGVTSQTVAIIGPEGHQRTFSKASSSAAWTADNSADSLSATPSGWSYKRADDDTLLTFDSSGRLQTKTGRGGLVTTYGYDGLDRLATISNGFGRTLSLGYDGAGRLSTVTTPDGRTIGYAYDTMGRLAFVTYPDGKSRGYLYENGSYPHALTGIVGESGVRWGTFGYDDLGRATSTQLAGGAERYEVSYPYSNSASVRDPVGTQRTYVYGSNKDKLAVTSGSLPSASGRADAANRVQDSNGLVTSETDFKGVTYGDKESGLYDNWNRSYCPACGRYTQPDRIGLGGGWNRFPHANLNPLKYADPDGRFAFLLPAAPTVGGWIAGAAGATAGAVLGWDVFGPMFQDRTPNNGEPASWHVNPGSGQERKYGADGKPELDIDWDHDHGQGAPHGHNWGPGGRDKGWPLSPWPRGRKSCN